MNTLDQVTVQEALGLGETHASWLGAIESGGAPSVPLRLPSPHAAAALLMRLGVDARDAEEVAGTLPSAQGQPALWWLLERSVHLMRQHMGEPEVNTHWPPLPPSLGAQGRLFLAYLFLAVFEDVRRWHAAHGVDDAISWETLSSLGRAMRIHRARQGEGGVFEHGWMTLPFRACLYEVGRLQYTPFRVTEQWLRRWADPATAEPSVPGVAPGDPAVGIHIPASGPLTPASVTASLLRARALFAKPTPWGPCRIAVCGSWLLDEQLAAYLPPSANIIRFQQRFTMLPGAGNGDGSVFTFVFRRQGPPASLDDLPQRTALERAIVAHLRAGGHWRTRTGWLAL